MTIDEFWIGHTAPVGPVERVFLTLLTCAVAMIFAPFCYTHKFRKDIGR